MMRLPIERVNLLEKDIEDWLWKNPDELETKNWDNVRWFGRQVKIPSGIADLVGVCRVPGYKGQVLFAPIVVEVKNVPIKSDALGQVARYAWDVLGVFDWAINDEEAVTLSLRWAPKMAVVGPSISDQTFAESQAFGIDVFTFNAKLIIDLGGNLSWTSEYQQRRAREREEASRNGHFVNAIEFLRGWRDAGEEVLETENRADGETEGVS